MNHCQTYIHPHDNLVAEIMDGFDDVVWSMTLPNLTPLYFNAAAAELYRCSNDLQDSSCLWLNRINVDDQPKMQQAIAQAQYSGSSQVRYCINESNGDRCFLARLKIFKDAAGLPIRLDAIATEITGIKENHQIEYRHQQTEEILFQGERRYYDMIQKQSDFILRSLPDTTITFANESLCEVLGSSLEEVIGKKWIDFAAPDDLQTILANLSIMSPEQSSFIAVNRDRRANDQIGWTQWINEGFFNQQGELVGIQSVGRDITDLKLSELALKQLNEELEMRIEQRTADLHQSEARNLAILHSLPDLLLLIKPDGTCIQCIMPVTQGKNKYLPIHHHLSEVLTAEDLQVQTNLYKAAIATGEVQIYEHEIFKYGKKVYEEVRIAPYCDDELLVIVRDITDRKLAEANLLKSDKHLKAAQRISKLGSWEFDLRTGNVVWSEEVFRIFGRDPHSGTPTYSDLRNHLHPDDWDRFNQTVQAAIDTAQSYDVEYRIYWTDGTLVYVLARGEIICDAMGKAIQIIGTVMDITDRKVAEQQLQTVTDRLTLALKSASIGIWEWDIANNRLIWDPRTYELYSVNPDPSVDAYTAWASRIYPSDLELAENEVRLALNGEKDYDHEFRIVLPDGSIRYLKAYASVQRNEEGLTQRMLGINFDITDRKLAEQTLIKSDTHLKIAQRIGKVGSWEYEINTGKLIWSDEIFRIYGLEPSNYPPNYDDLKLYIHPDDWEHFSQTVQNAVNFAQSYDLEHRIIQPNGTLIYVLARGEMIYDASGQLTHILGTAMDITDRKLIEQQLQSVTDRLTLAVKSALIGIWEWDIVNNILIWDERMYEIYGVPITSSTNTYETWSNSLHPDDRVNTESVIQLCVQGEKDFDIEFRIILADGNIRYIKAFALLQRNHAGEAQKMIGINFDITDRKLAEAELHRSHDLREALFNESTDAMFLVDPETVLTTDCNNTAMRLFEVSHPSELIGIEGHILQRTQFSDQELQDILLNLETQGFWSSEVEYVSRRGRVFWGNLAVKPITVAGKTINLVRVSDISDRKLAEAKIVQTANQLANTNRELESFCYSVSHDLRAPLRHMNGFVNALQQRLKTHEALSDPKVMHYLQVINKSSQKMGNLIDGLLTLSRYGRRPLESQPISIRALVDEAIEIISTDPSHNPLVKFAIGDLPQSIVGDPTLLQQVFLNLISNAVKFSRHQSHPYIEINSLPDGTICIKDNGVGFQMEYADKLFGVFQRLHTEVEFEGTGIGLAIVQRIIQRHGGSVWAEGYPDQGATFFIRL